MQRSTGSSRLLPPSSPRVDCLLSVQSGVEVLARSGKLSKMLAQAVRTGTAFKAPSTSKAGHNANVGSGSSSWKKALTPRRSIALGGICSSGGSMSDNNNNNSKMSNNSTEEKNPAGAAAAETIPSMVVPMDISGMLMMPPPLPTSLTASTTVGSGATTTPPSTSGAGVIGTGTNSSISSSNAAADAAAADDGATEALLHVDQYLRRGFVLQQLDEGMIIRCRVYNKTKDGLILTLRHVYDTEESTVAAGAAAAAKAATSKGSTSLSSSAAAAAAASVAAARERKQEAMNQACWSLALSRASDDIFHQDACLRWRRKGVADAAAAAAVAAGGCASGSGPYGASPVATAVTHNEIESCPHALLRNLESLSIHCICYTSQLSDEAASAAVAAVSASAAATAATAAALRHNSSVSSGATHTVAADVQAAAVATAAEQGRSALHSFRIGDEVKALVISCDQHLETVHVSMSNARLRGMHTTHVLGLTAHPPQGKSCKRGSGAGASAGGTIGDEVMSIAASSPLRYCVAGRSPAYMPGRKSPAYASPAHNYASSSSASPSYYGRTGRASDLSQVGPAASGMSWGYGSHSTSPYHVSPATMRAVWKGGSNSAAPSASQNVSRHLDCVMAISSGSNADGRPVATAHDGAACATNNSGGGAAGTPALSSNANGPSSSSFLETLKKRVIFRNPAGGQIFLEAYHISERATLLDGSQSDASLLLLSTESARKASNYRALRAQQNRQWAERNVSMGMEAVRQGDYKMALKFYAHAQDMCSSLPQVHVARGACYVIQGKYQKAVNQFEQALRLDPALEYVRTYLKLTQEKMSLQLEPSYP